MTQLEIEELHKKIDSGTATPGEVVLWMESEVPMNTTARRGLHILKVNANRPLRPSVLMPRGHLPSNPITSEDPVFMLKVGAGILLVVTLVFWLCS